MTIPSSPVAWMFKEYVWATGLCGHVWRDKLEHEAPDTGSENIKDIVPLYVKEYVDHLRSESEKNGWYVRECSRLQHLLEVNGIKDPEDYS